MATMLEMLRSKHTILRIDPSSSSMLLPEQATVLGPMKKVSFQKRSCFNLNIWCKSSADGFLFLKLQHFGVEHWFRKNNCFPLNATFVFHDFPATALE